MHTGKKENNFLQDIIKELHSNFKIEIENEMEKSKKIVRTIKDEQNEMKNNHILERLEYNK